MNPIFLNSARKDFTFFFEDMLGASPEEFQKKIIRSISKYPRVAVKATHSVGKTWLSARVMLAFMTLYPSAKVVTTAPTYRQVELLLWGEANSAYKNSKTPLGGNMLTNKWKISDEWWAIGFSPKKEAEGGEQQKGSTFQGIHAKRILVIFDEATGIPADVWRMVEGLLTSGEVVKFLAIGNPTTRECEFFKCFKDPLWHKETLSCFDSPNMQANGFNDIDDMKEEISFLRTLSETDRLERFASYKLVNHFLLRADWAMSYVYKLGLEHPLVQSKVLGEFPEENEFSMFKLGLVEKAINRNSELAVDETQTRFIGVDVARFGSDSSIINEIIGWKNTRKRTLTKFDTMEVAGQVVRFVREEKEHYKTIILVDGTGIGSGVVDRLKELKRELGLNFDVYESHYGAAPEDKIHYLNAKAEMLSKLAEDLKEKLGLIDEDIYREELPSIQHSYDSKGRTVIESKDEYKSRTGRQSPDNADSLALANYARYTKSRSTFFPRTSETKNFTKTSETKTSQIKIDIY